MRIPGSCSWCFRSILNVRSFALDCVTHLIGDGLDTHLWLDPWHPRGVLYLALGDNISYEMHPNRTAKVCSIRHNYEWSVTHPHSTALISVWDSLCLVDTLCESTDRVTWIASKSGTYTLRSAYESIRPSGPLQGWQQIIWFKGCVPRFSFFSWLLFKGRLSTLDRLHGWGIIQNTTCYLCGCNMESTHHLFFECSYSSTIWSVMLDRCLLSHSPSGWNFEQGWIIDTFKGAQVVDTIRKLALTTTIYHIWAERNRRAMSSSTKPKQLIISYIILDVQRRLNHIFKQVNDSPSIRSILDSWEISPRYSTISSSWCHWRYPPHGWIALSTDASLRNTVAGLGCVLRDHCGSPQVAVAVGTPVSGSILFHELQAILRGLREVSNRNYQRVIVQSDSKVAIDILNGLSNPPWKCWTILSQIVAIQRRFIEVTFSFVYREINRVADFLSHFCSTVEDITLFPADFPDELTRLIHLDANQTLFNRTT